MVMNGDECEGWKMVRLSIEAWIKHKDVNPGEFLMTTME